jgi:hypothetical protein
MLNWCYSAETAVRTVRNGHGNFDVRGKFSNNQLYSFGQSIEKEYRKRNDILTMVILPFVIIYHEKEKFLEKFP